MSDPLIAEKGCETSGVVLPWVFIA